MLRKLTVILLLMLVVGVPLAAAQDGPRRADEFDVPYIPNGDEEQVLDIYYPTVGEPPYPVMVMYHGGSWFSGSRDGMRRTALLFADEGYLVLNMEYRTGDYEAPTQAFDALCGMGWIHANADAYEMDTDRIYLWAESLGGYYAAMAAYAPSDLPGLEDCPYQIPRERDRTSGMIAIAGTISLWDSAHTPERVRQWAIVFDVADPLDFELRAADPDLPSDDASVVADVVDTESEAAALYDPVTYIDRNDPPALLIHHALDEVVPVATSEGFATVAREEGANVTLLIYNDQYFYPYHGFWYADDPNRATAQTTLGYIFAFLAAPQP